MSAGDLGPTVTFPPGLFERPTSLFFWGSDRIVLNQLAFHAARGADPDFVWLEIRSASDPRPRGDPAGSGLIPPTNLVEVKAELLRPRLGRRTGALAKILDLDPRGGLVREILPYLQFPRFLANVLGGMLPVGRPRVLAVANSDRISEFYPARRGLVRRFVRTIQRLDISLVVSYCGPPRRDFGAWDHLFELSSASESPTPAAAASLTCRRGAPSPAWQVDTSYPLPSIQGWQSTLEDLDGSAVRSPPLAFIPAVAEEAAEE